MNHELTTVAYLDELGEPISSSEARLYDEELPELVRRQDVAELVKIKLYGLQGDKFTKGAVDQILEEILESVEKKTDEVDNQ